MYSRTRWKNYLLLGTFTLYTDERPRLLQFMGQGGKIFRRTLHSYPKYNMNAQKTKEPSAAMFWQMTLSADSVLPVEPLEERHPLGEIRLGPGVVEPALARLVADEAVAQCGGVGVDLLHVPQG